MAAVTQEPGGSERNPGAAQAVARASLRRLTISSEYWRRRPAASIASPLTLRVMESMSHASASGRQPLAARYQQPDQAAPLSVSQKSAASSGVLPIARPKAA